MLNFNENDVVFFKKKGYITKDLFCDNNNFLNIANDLRLSIDEYINSNLNKIQELGGYKSGNLNFIAPIHSEKIINLLYQNNFKDNLKKIIDDDISKYELILGGNINFPKSKFQFFHTDGKWDPRMIIINIATSDIDNSNGPLEVIERSHIKNFPYWKFILKNFFFKKKKLILKKGEILIREHRLWHRGTTNKSNKFREMIGLMFIKRKPKENISLKVNSENLLIFSNIFGVTKKEKIKELIFLYLKPLFSIYKIIISIIK